MKEKVNNQVLFDQVSTMPEQAVVQDCLHAGYDQHCWFSEQVLIVLVHLQSNYDKMKSEVPKYKMITPSILADRLRVRAMYWLKKLSPTRWLSYFGKNLIARQANITNCCADQWQSSTCSH